jgi:hypothetical protein
MTNPINSILGQLKPASFQPGEHDGSIVVTFAAQVEVPLNVADSVVAQFDEPEVMEATRSAAANRLIGLVYGPAAAQLIELRDKMPKKYQPKINKILATFISG